MRRVSQQRDEILIHLLLFFGELEHIFLHNPGSTVIDPARGSSALSMPPRPHLLHVFACSLLLSLSSANQLERARRDRGTSNNVTLPAYPERPTAFRGTMYEGSAPPLSLTALETASRRRTCNASFGTFTRTFSVNVTLANGDVVVVQKTTSRQNASSLSCLEAPSSSSPCCPRGSICEHGLCRACELGMSCPQGTISGPDGTDSVAATLALLHKDYPDANSYDPPGPGQFMYNVCPVGRYCPSPWDDVFPCPFNRSPENSPEKCRPGTYIRGLRARLTENRESRSPIDVNAPPWSSWWLSSGTVPCSEDGMFLCHSSTSSNPWCPAGYFCPYRMVALTCPAEHWCPMGSATPFRCRAGWLDTECDVGSYVKSQGFSFTVIGAMLVVGIAVALQAHKLSATWCRTIKKSKKKKNATCGCCRPTSSTTTDAYPNAGGHRGKRIRKSMIDATLGGRNGEGGNSPGNDDDDGGEEVDTMSEMDAVRATFPAREGISFSFEDLCLHVKAGGRTKKILNKVTGSIKAGTLNAVMGPSGAGKTTFMNVLCDRVGYGERSGKLLINSTTDRFANHRDIMGFVPQDDTVHEDLTVRENLHYAACLRLPLEDKECSRCCSLMPSLGALCGLNKSASRDTPFALRNYYEQHVHVVLRMMQLEHIQDSIVGSVEKRGISGGQRKRVNIGLEIVADPIVLFLDEPTSGLDSTSSGVIMKAW